MLRGFFAPSRHPARAPSSSVVLYRFGPFRRICNITLSLSRRLSPRARIVSDLSPKPGCCCCCCCWPIGNSNNKVNGTPGPPGTGIGRRTVGSGGGRGGGLLLAGYCSMFRPSHGKLLKLAAATVYVYYGCNGITDVIRDIRIGKNEIILTG